MSFLRDMSTRVTASDLAAILNRLDGDTIDSEGAITQLKALLALTTNQPAKLGGASRASEAFDLPLSDLYDDDDEKIDDTTFPAKKGRISGGKKDHADPILQTTYAEDVDLLLSNTKLVSQQVQQGVSMVVNPTINKDLIIINLTASHVIHRWYNIVRFLRSNVQVQTFNISNFVDPDLHEPIVDAHNALTFSEMDYFEFPKMKLKEFINALFRAVTNIQSIDNLVDELKKLDIFYEHRQNNEYFQWTPTRGLALYKKYYEKFKLFMNLGLVKFPDFIDQVGMSNIAKIYCNGYSTTRNPISVRLPYRHIADYAQYKKSTALHIIHTTILDYFADQHKIASTFEYFTDLTAKIPLKAKDTQKYAPAPKKDTEAPPVTAIVNAPSAHAPAFTSPPKSTPKSQMPCLAVFSNKTCSRSPCPYSHDKANADLITIATKLQAQFNANKRPTTKPTSK